MGRSGHIIGCGFVGLFLCGILRVDSGIVHPNGPQITDGRSDRQYYFFRQQPVFHQPPIPAESTSWFLTNKSGIIYDMFLEHQMNIPNNNNNINNNNKPTNLEAVDGECYTNDGKLGQCMSFEKCNPMLHLNYAGNENPDQEAHSNLREEIYELMKNKNCSAVIHSGKSERGNVCCPPPPPNPDFENSLFQNPDEESSPKVYAAPQCGVNSVATTNIVNGSMTVAGELPWMVVIYGKSGKQTCGGSLLSESVVLTAAHCISSYTSSDVAKLKIHIGDWNLKSTSDGEHEVRGISKIVKHKHFNLQTFVNDIALLKLDRPVRMTNRIQPICLGSSDSDLVNTNLLVAGWGRTYYGGPTSPVLLKVDVRVWDNPSCGRVYQNIAPAGIQETMLCAGDKGKDSCVGDSGGPLMQKVGQVYYQVGIVSFGKGCATLPGVYTRLTHFNRWISNNMKKHF